MEMQKLDEELAAVAAARRQALKRKHAEDLRTLAEQEAGRGSQEVGLINRRHHMWRLGDRGRASACVRGARTHAGSAVCMAARWFAAAFLTSLDAHTERTRVSVRAVARGKVGGGVGWALCEVGCLGR